MFENGLNIGSVTDGTVYGNLGKSYSNALYAINRHENNDNRQGPNDHVGYTFFVRPMMNFSRSNLRNDRLLYQYLTQKNDTVETYVRMMFDRLLASKESIVHPFADNLQFYIPVLSNNLMSLSGFPDVSVDSYVSPSGSRKQQYNLLDGTDEINESLDINVVFKNTYEDAVVKLLTPWVRYIVKVKEGVLNPYTGFIGRRLVDYHSRVFRLIMTEDKKYVKRIAATGPIYPDVNEIGKYFNVSESRIYNDEIKTHNIRFKCMGVEYDDPILLKEFNMTAGAFNPMIRKINNGATPDSVGLVKLSAQGEASIKNRGYCRINLATKELEWYMEKEK